jgi:hypothetical protein
MHSRAVRHAGRCIGLVMMTGAAGVAQAQDVQTSVVASAGISGETNPYNETNAGGLSLAATAELAPTISVRDEQTSVTINALAQFRQFFRRYGLEDNYSANTSIVSRRSDSLTLRGNSTFSYNRGGYNGFGRPSLSAIDPISTTPDLTQPDPTVPLQDPLLLISDVTLLGQRTRVTSYGSGLGADARLGAYSSLSLDLTARALRFKSTGFDDYNSYRAEFQYSYQLDELISVGLIGGYGKTNYLDLSQGDVNSYDALASLDRRFGGNWSLSLGAGASFTDIDARAGRPAVHYTSLSVRGRFCWRGEFSQMCVGGQRSPQPAANGSVRVTDSVNADYSLRLSERERLSLSASYARTGRGRDLMALPASDFVSGSARYDRDITKRIGAFASASVSKISNFGASRRANIGFALGVQARIGSGQ